MQPTVVNMDLPKESCVLTALTVFYFNVPGNADEERSVKV